MKINKIEKIDEHFLGVKAESIFKALKKDKLVGIKRSEIENLLKKYSLEDVYDYLRTRYRKRNYFLIYIILFFAISSLLAIVSLFQYFFNTAINFSNYLNFEYYYQLVTLDYFIILLFFLLILTFLLILREIGIYLRRLK